eukprot:6185592-Pyramimonas_sp.AAC.1
MTYKAWPNPGLPHTASSAIRIIDGARARKRTRKRMRVTDRTSWTGRRLTTAKTLLVATCSSPLFLRP